MKGFKELFREIFNDGIVVGQEPLTNEERNSFFEILWKNYYSIKVNKDER